MKYIIIPIMFLLSSCGDPNSEPKYGKSFGLPENCRAYVQAAIDNYRDKTEEYKNDSIDTAYYCEPNNWYSQDCHQHLADMQFTDEQKNEQVNILLSSLERNCGKSGELWTK